MIVNLLGVKRLDFTPQGSDPINGVKLFFSFDDHDKNTIGDVCDNKYISDARKEIITIDPLDYIGQRINIDFDQKGKIQCVSAV